MDSRREKEYMPAPPKIISCEVLRNEIETVLARDGRDLAVDFVDGGLHDYPERMRAALQERIDATPGDGDIYLCCARCSNGTVGLRGGDRRLVVPAADDCISLLLGSRARYLEEHDAQPGTYYYTRGWIDFIEDPYKQYLKIIPKYGEERSAQVAHTIMEHYTRLAVIETPGVTDLADKEEYLETVRRFYDLPLERLTGSLRFLEKLVSGPHDEEFIVIQPGDELDEERFWELSAS